LPAATLPNACVILNRWQLSADWQTLRSQSRLDFQSRKNRACDGKKTFVHNANALDSKVSAGCILASTHDSSAAPFTSPRYSRDLADGRRLGDRARRRDEPGRDIDD
jgi:hypothetical protein